jgi:hypothetical protein
MAVETLTTSASYYPENLSTLAVHPIDALFAPVSVPELVRRAQQEVLSTPLTRYQEALYWYAQEMDVTTPDAFEAMERRERSWIKKIYDKTMAAAEGHTDKVVVVMDLDANLLERPKKDYVVRPGYELLTACLRAQLGSRMESGVLTTWTQEQMDRRLPGAITAVINPQYRISTRDYAKQHPHIAALNQLPPEQKLQNLRDIYKPEVYQAVKERRLGLEVARDNDGKHEILMDYSNRERGKRFILVDNTVCTASIGGNPYVHAVYTGAEVQNHLMSRDALGETAVRASISYEVLAA